MYLDAVRPEDTPVYDAGTGHCGSEIYGTWENWQPASVSHHGQACCEIVKEWIIATDQSLLNGGNELTGPRWLRHRYEWGPTRYPIHWCEIGRSKVLDCGVHAAIAQEVFLARGVRCFRAQFVQEYSEGASEQWQLKWEDRDAITTWIEGKLIYHEGCAVIGSDGVAKLWDPSAGWWLDPDTTSGYGSVRALRIHAPAGAEAFDWGGHILPANEWAVIERPMRPTPLTSLPNRTSGSVRPLPARARLRSTG
jgi:hypothetical protein